VQAATARKGRILDSVSGVNRGSASTSDDSAFHSEPRSQSQRAEAPFRQARPIPFPIRIDPDAAWPRRSDKHDGPIREYQL